MTTTTVRVIISGRVQGVGYRAWTGATARNLNLKGWVRNLPDGTVEAVFSGKEMDVMRMLSACKMGPPASKVMSLTQLPCNEVPEGPFMSRPTA